MGNGIKGVKRQTMEGTRTVMPRRWGRGPRHSHSAETCSHMHQKSWRAVSNLKFESSEHNPKTPCSLTHKCFCVFSKNKNILDNKNFAWTRYYHLVLGSYSNFIDCPNDVISSCTFSFPRPGSSPGPCTAITLYISLVSLNLEKFLSFS